MSHFVVMVVSKTGSEEELEQILEPYNENQETAPYPVKDQAPWQEQIKTAIKNFRELDAKYKAKELAEGIRMEGRHSKQYQTEMLAVERYEAHVELYPDIAGSWSIMTDRLTKALEVLNAYEGWDPGPWRFTEDGLDLQEMSTYNPNSKWDWWVVGGRWSGALLTKETAKAGVPSKPGTFDVDMEQPFVPGQGFKPTQEWEEKMVGRCDSARIGDIDFDTLRTEKAEQAGDRFDEMVRVTGITDESPRPISWDDMLKKHDVSFDHDIERTPEQVEEHRAKIDAARSAYHSQPWVAKFREANGPFFGGPEDFFLEDGVTLEESRLRMMNLARAAAIGARAMVIDGEWVERGRMGWFGMSDDTMTSEEWYKVLSEKIDTLDKDLWLTMVDCHI